MDLIESIRHMMAEENFSGAEQALEVALISATQTSRGHYVTLYLDVLLQQKKNLPDHLVLEHLSDLTEKDFTHSLMIFENADASLKASDDYRVQFFRMRLAEERGHIKELHDLISDFHLRLFQRSLPVLPEFIEKMKQKYFRGDFQLRLQGLALTLIRRDLVSAESQTRELILEIFERSSPKILREKLTALKHVLSNSPEKGPLDIYLSFITIYLSGISEKKDYKRIAEMVIYFDDFRFESMIMQVLVKNDLQEIAHEFASELAVHPGYDFVYIAKHFPELKRFFADMSRPTREKPLWESPDLTLEEEVSPEVVMHTPVERTEDEEILIHLVTGQDFSDSSLLDLSVGFLQSEMPRVASAAALLVHARATDDRIKLKAAYLTLTGYLQSGDYRKALDLALESMKLVSTTDDLLSFLYCEAEAYLRLEQNREARQVLKKILSIDSDYRMARERLEQLG